VKHVLIVIAGLLLQACGTPHNTIRDGDDDRLMLRGNDPLSYFAGKPAIKARYDGDVYRFASELNRQLFEQDPARYAPAFAGFCASGAHYALKAAIDARVSAVHKGRLYLFGSERSKANWMMDADDNVRLGQEYWENETKDVPYRIQNLKRYLFKVPHYRTDAQLDAEHLRRFGRLPPGAPPPKN
jgi:YHS domain-containing protein